MTNPERTQETAGGLVGKVAGKAKEAAGSALGNDDLAREGRLQQAQAEAEVDARREAQEAEQREAEAEVEGARGDLEIERERLRSEIAAEEREGSKRHAADTEKRRKAASAAAFRKPERPSPTA